MTFQTAISRTIFSAGFTLLCVMPTQAALVEDSRFFATPAGTSASFGSSIAAEGNTLVVGAVEDSAMGLFTGSAYLIDTSTGNQIAKLTEPDSEDTDRFGQSVAISGNTAMIGASGKNTATGVGTVFLYDTSTGQKTGELVPDQSTVNFGWSVATNGNTIAVGAWGDSEQGTYSGAVYLFDANTGNQTAKLTADDAAAWDRFGYSVAIAGNTVVVGNQNESAYLFDASTGAQITKLTANDAGPNDNFGGTVAINGNTVAIGARTDDYQSGSGGGSVYLFDATTGTQTNKLSVSNPNATSSTFGASLTFMDDILMVGETYGAHPGAGTFISNHGVYLFDVSTGSLVDTLMSSTATDQNSFGASMAFNDDQIFVGAFSDQTQNPSYYGSVHVFDYPPSSSATHTAVPTPHIPLLILSGALVSLTRIRRTA